VGCAFVIDLPDLGGSRRIAERGFAVTSLCSFEGE
jgi:adenine phosphoribosyltransferase